MSRGDLHVCYSVKDNCYNWYDSYGMICVHCGCCSKDPLKRATARLKLCKEQLEKEYNFDMWDDNPTGRAIQEMNIKLNIQYFKRRIRYYEARVKKLKGIKKDGSNISD